MFIDDQKTDLASRRRAMKTIGSLSMLSLFGCGGGSSGTASQNAEASATEGTVSTSTTVAATAAGSCVLTPTETEGPFPLLAILSNPSVVRKDIRETRTGIPLTLMLTLQNAASCAPISNAAIYVWHCDKEGEYSGYSSGVNGNHQSETFLRGVQATDSNGKVTFTTIYPGWYAGRITHIHIQVYLNDNLNVTATATTQLAFPQEVNAAVYSTPLYTKGQNTSVTSLAADNVFSDGAAYQTATVSGDAVSGYAATLTIGIAA